MFGKWFSVPKITAEAVEPSKTILGSNWDEMPTHLMLSFEEIYKLC